MFDKCKIVHKDKKAREEHTICCFCKRFYCTHNLMCCSGVLPKWKFLYRLMREVCANDTCKKFDMLEAYKQKMKNYQR